MNKHKDCKMLRINDDNEFASLSPRSKAFIKIGIERITNALKEVAEYLIHPKPLQSSLSRISYAILCAIAINPFVFN